MVLVLLASHDGARAAFRRRDHCWKLLPFGPSHRIAITRSPEKPSCKFVNVSVTTCKSTAETHAVQLRSDWHEGGFRRLSSSLRAWHGRRLDLRRHQRSRASARDPEVYAEQPTARSEPRTTMNESDTTALLRLGVYLPPRCNLSRAE